MTRFGLALFGHQPHEHVPLAVCAEEAGFRDLWIGEHVAAPAVQRTGLYHEADIVRDDTDLYDIWTICGAVLGATQQLCVSPGVLIAALRHPVATALSAATAARMSGGRFRLGVGAGWLEEEFEALGIEFVNRFKRLDEIVRVVRLMAQGGSQAFDGDFYRFAPVRTSHDAVSYPIILGGLTEPALRRAARIGDGWYGVPGLSLADHLDIRSIVAKERGDGPPFAFHARLSADFVPGDALALEEHGFDHIIVPWEALWSSGERRTLPLDAKLERLRAVAGKLGLAT